MANINWSQTSPLIQTSVEAIEAKPGIYRLSYQSAEGSLYVFFVGRSDTSLKDDLLKLIYKETENICIKTHLENLECYFRYVIIEDEDTRKNFERTLYDHFKPKCNLDVPTGNLIELNLS